MAQEVLIKVYGHVWPISQDIVQALRPHFPSSDHMDDEEMLVYEKDMLRMAFEGIYIDMEEILPIVQSFLQNQSQGKIDYIDLEAWTLTRHSIKQGLMVTNSASLNAVMDYAASK